MHRLDGKHFGAPGWTVFHNGDFSGDVELVHDDGLGHGEDSIQVSFTLLKGIVAEWLKGELVARLESMGAHELFKLATIDRGSPAR